MTVLITLEKAGARGSSWSGKVGAGEPLSSSSNEELGVGTPSSMLGVAVTRGSPLSLSTLRAGDAELAIVFKIAGGAAGDNDAGAGGGRQCCVSEAGS